MGGSVRVLFVDDQESVCDLINIFCTSLGMEFSVARDAREALDFITKERFALLVTDLEMPEMDGVALARKVREQQPDIGIFAFTGGSAAYSLRDLENTFDKVFFKPSDYSRMIANAMMYLAQKKYPFLK